MTEIATNKRDITRFTALNSCLLKTNINLIHTHLTIPLAFYGQLYLHSKKVLMIFFAIT